MNGVCLQGVSLQSGVHVEAESVVREFWRLMGTNDFQAVKAVLAEITGRPEWNRVLPPMAEVTMPERSWLIRDFLAWESRLPAECQTFGKPDRTARPRLALAG